MHLSTNILTYLLGWTFGGCDGKVITGSFITKVNLIPSIFFSPISFSFILYLILFTSFANLNFPFFSL